ncbi:hypothetical protein ACFWPU_42220 [Streptomyces sp. NPDC058471]|uniref:hypothetical protein n=1 Tax=Streptomyces sp. NPDC058471 TaxID=3346516 RepID=UPI00365A08D5
MEHAPRPAEPGGFAELSGSYWMAPDSPVYGSGAESRFRQCEAISGAQTAM